MGHSSLMGTDRAPSEPAGRDTASLGPSDSSDSGSDMAGIETHDIGDPGLPVDVALRDDEQHALTSADSLGGAASDAAGTGERRSAAADAGQRDAPDISLDRVFEPGVGTIDAYEDADLGFIDDAEAGDALEDEDEDDIAAEDAPARP